MNAAEELQGCCWQCAGPHHSVHVADSASDLVASCVERAREAAESRTLLRVPFETLFQYLQVRGACP